MKYYDKIVLVGYMASGKSLIGKDLAKSIDKPFFDLDTYIAKKEDMSIPEIFAIKGELHFRNLELKYIKELLNSNKSFVLALGGGTPTLDGVMDLINKKAFGIYLKASIQTLYNRLSISEKDERPLLEFITPDFLKSYIEMHLSERVPYYSQARKTVVVDDMSVAEIVRKIKKEINYSK